MSDEDPIKILQVRFAKGEITAEQYEQMLSFLTRDISSFKQSETEKKVEIHDSSASPAATSEGETIDPVIETADKETDKDVDKEVDKESKAEEKNKEGIEEESGAWSEPVLTEPERTTVKEIASAIADAEGPVSSDAEPLHEEVAGATYNGEGEAIHPEEEEFASGTVLDTPITDEQIESIEISEEIPEELTEKTETSESFLSQEDLGNVCYVTAVNLVQAGEFEKAYPFIEKSLTIQPDLTLSWLYKGFIHHNRKEYEEAVSCFDKVIAKDPTQIRAWLFKGYSLFHLHQDEKALECFNRVIKEDKTQLRALITRVTA